MSERKYELTEYTRVHNGETVYRMRALKKFGTVMPGDLLGYVPDYSCIPQEGDAMLYSGIMTKGCHIIDNAVAINCIIENGSTLSDNAYAYNCKIDDSIIGCNHNIRNEELKGVAL